MRGRGRGKCGSSNSHPHPQRALNLSKKFQLKSIGERERERRGGTLTCLLSKCERMGREVLRKRAAAAAPNTSARAPNGRKWRRQQRTHEASVKLHVSHARLVTVEEKSGFELYDNFSYRNENCFGGFGYMRNTEHTQTSHKNFSFTRENCRDGVSV